MWRTWHSFFQKEKYKINTMTNSDWRLKVKRLITNRSLWIFPDFHIKAMTVITWRTKQNCQITPLRTWAGGGGGENGLSGLCLEIKCFVWFAWLDKILLHSQTMRSSVISVICCVVCVCVREREIKREKQQKMTLRCLQVSQIFLRHV